ncbi:sulfatase family protein [Pirellulaceae bacterium SH467]
MRSTYHLFHTQVKLRRGLVWIAMSFALCLGGVTAPFARAAKPNFVVFLSDDHSQRDSEPYGATDVRTPHLMRLAQRGLLFEQAFIASPACAPSRTAMLTGRMPARNGAEANHSYKRDDVLSLPKVLKALGYETAAFGKVAHGKTDVARHGFDLFEEKHDIETVRSFLRARDANKPLCLFVGTHEPHVPWPENRGYQPRSLNLPPTHIDTPETRNFRSRYYSDVTEADRRLGEVMDAVDELLPKDSTAFLYTSDHGAQWPFGKWNLYDEGIRVPLIVSWPSVVPEKARTQAMVQWIDLLPTLIDLAGGAPQSEWDGKSFATVLRQPDRPHRKEIFTTHSGDGKMNVYPIRSIRTDEWKLIWNLHPEFAHTTHIDKALARDGGRYWISWFEKAKMDEQAAATVRRYHERPEWELYHLPSDPWETINLAPNPTHAETLADLKGKLQQWMQEQGDTKQVFNDPRLLSDPTSTVPGENAHTDTPNSPAAKPTNPLNSK